MQDTPKRADDLRELLTTGTPEQIRAVLASFDEAELADILEAVSEEQSERAFDALGIERQARVLREIDDEETREEILDHLPAERLADIAEEMPSDDATDLYEELPEERRDRVLREIEPETRAEIQELTAYDSESAGGIMQKELIRITAELTVGQATNVVRRDYSPDMGEIFDVFVVDGGDRILGRVRTRQLLFTPDARLVSEIMRDDVRTVPVTMDQEEIADIVADYDLASIAVVDAQDRLVGRILVDDILDVVEEEATEDVAKMAGTAPEDVYSRSVLRTVRARLPWLIATFAGGLLSAFLITHWEEDLVAHIPLYAAVIPIVMGMSGNVGMQAATVTVRGLAIGEIDYARIGRVVGKEMISGLVFAAFFGALLFPLLLWVIAPYSDPEWQTRMDATSVVLVPAVAIALTIVAAAATGTLVPLVLDKLGRDPAVASAPFITTTVDVLAIVLLVAVKLWIL